MKTKALYLIVFVFAALLAQAQTVATAGDYSPAVVAKDFHATYGVRADVVQAILGVYARKGLSPQARKARTENLIQTYSTTVSQAKGVLQLTPEDRERLGINAEPSLVAALNWDLFAKQHYLSTSGAYSPAIVAKGDVNIWFGIPEGALRTLAERLEENEVELDQFSDRLAEMVTKYNELRKEMESYSGKDPVVRQAEALLEEGKLEEAEALLASDYQASKKRLAYKAYLYGKTKELLLKYEEAAGVYRDAVALDSGNVKYLMEYGGVCNEIDHFAEAKIILERGIQIQRNILGEADSNMISLKTRLAVAYASLAKFEEATRLHEEALALSIKIYGVRNKITTNILCELGGILVERGELEIGTQYLDSAIQIERQICEPFDPQLAIGLCDLGKAYCEARKFDQAIIALSEAFLILDSNQYCSKHPYLASICNNIGMAHYELGDYRQAHGFLLESIDFDSAVNGEESPYKGMLLNNLGRIASAMGNFDEAMELYQSSLVRNSRFLGQIHPFVAYNFRNMGIVEMENDHLLAAIDYYQKAFTIDSIVYGMQSFNVGFDFYGIGLCYLKLFSVEIAEQYFEKVEMIFEEGDGISAIESLIILKFKAAILLAKGEFQKSIRLSRTVLDAEISQLGGSHPYVAFDFLKIAVCWDSLHDFDSSSVYYNRALSILLKSYSFENARFQKALKSACISGLADFKKRMDHQPLGGSDEDLKNFIRRIDSITNPYVTFDIIIKLVKQIDRSKIRQNFVRSLESLQVLVRSNKLQHRFDNSQFLTAESSNYSILGMNGGPPQDLQRLETFCEALIVEAQGNKKEAKALAKHLIPAAIAAKDEELINLLKEAGWMKNP